MPQDLAMAQAQRSHQLARARGVVVSTLWLWGACGGIAVPSACARPTPTAPLPPLAPASAAARSPAASSAAPAPVPLASSEGPSGDSPSVGATIGTAQPLVVEQASPTGSYVVYCQARHDDDGNGAVRVSVGPGGRLEGDGLRRFLALAFGAERRIDDLWAASEDGRFLVTREGEATLLVDTRSGAATPLPAQARAGALGVAEHPLLGFDGASQRLVYTRAGGDGRAVVVRDLASGKEAAIAPGAGKLHRVSLDATGRWVLLSVVAHDDNGNGRLDLPVAEPPLARPCPGPLPTFVVHPARGDRATQRVALARGGAARDVPGLVAALSRHLLVRLPGDGLVLEDAGGKQRRLGPGACRGHLIHADVERELALFACERTEGPDKGKNEVELWGGGSRRRLGLFVTAQAVDAPPRPPTRLVPLYPGRDAVLVDLERETTHPLLAGDQVLAVAGARALVRRGQTLVMVNVDEGTTTSLATVRGAVPALLRRPPAVVIGGLVVDAARGAVLGTVPERAFAITRGGTVLVARGSEGDAETLATGPLEWRPPCPE